MTLHECDLRDATSTFDTVAKVKPDWIFHLAAQSFVPTSWVAPTESLTTNILAQVNIFEAVRRLGLKTRIQLACSSEEYGMVFPDETPIRETNPLRPLSPYAVSKVAQDLLGYQYWMSWKVDSVRTRGFNHEGPRRGPVFVASDFAKQIADIERGSRPPVLNVGNLEAKRDFTDVRDMVRGYVLALEKGEPGEVYNLCRGRCWTIRETLDMLLALTKVKIEVKQDPARLRPSDVPILLGDNSKFVAATGWQPTIPFEQTLRDMLEYWRSR
jgi:GDP-4-dehydro-6-deoxy-D-mannose reductase